MSEGRGEGGKRGSEERREGRRKRRGERGTEGGEKGEREGIEVMHRHWCTLLPLPSLRLLPPSLFPSSFLPLSLFCLSLSPSFPTPPPPHTYTLSVLSPPFSFTGTIANKAQEARGNNRSVMPLDAFYWAARVLQWREQYVDANSEMKRQPCEAPSWLGSSLATIGRELGMPRKHVLVIAC